MSYLPQLDENPQNTSGNGGNPDFEIEPQPAAGSRKQEAGSRNMLTLLLLSILARTRKVNIREIQEL